MLKFVSLKLEEERHKALKQEALDRNIPLQELMEEIINDHFQDKTKAPNASKRK